MRWLLLLGCMTLTQAARAADPPEPSGEHTHCRAGYPMCIAPWARPGISPREAGGLVGGGTSFRQAGPSYCDGTWGWDYVGPCAKFHHIFLGWSYDRKHPARPGSYKTDGPPVVDVFAEKPLRHAVERHRGE